HKKAKLAKCRSRLFYPPCLPRGHGSRGSISAHQNRPLVSCPNQGTSGLRKRTCRDTIGNILSSILELRSAVLQLPADFDALFHRLPTRDLPPTRCAGTNRCAAKILRSHSDCFPLGAVPIPQPPNGKVIKPGIGRHQPGEIKPKTAPLGFIRQN